MNNSLAEVHPELITEWSEKNLPLTPDDITFGSNKKVWWKGTCGHEWQTSVKARSNGEKCPICSGARVIAGINDLATLEPLQAKQWSKKNKIKPTEVSIGSHKKVIWRCKKGHEWEAVVKSRTINKTGCPYCSHNKVLAGFNDLATLLPDIAAEWSDRNYPLLPTQVTVFAKGLKAELGSDRLLGVPLETYIPSEKLAIESGSADENIQIMKAYMCKQRGIRLIKLPMKGTELDYANNLKKAFQSVHIFISSDTEEDVEII
ncbi:zinc-ribbon domain-containing protein, partial [Blautia sp.]|uniref:zinc-ribbon domain-containing protein n=1 Tax=Blautia sp. TaxID=1955243 RepID=UPI00257AAEE5